VKRATIWILVGLPIALLVGWIASNTYWTDVKLPLPLKGDAATNPFYAAQHFAEALGSQSAWDRVFTTPSTDAVIVVSSWHWSLSSGRRDALKRWVESGGRLVVGSSLADGDGDFERWTGIATDYREVNVDEERPSSERDESCHSFNEERDTRSGDSTAAGTYWLCDFDTFSFLTTARPPAWALRDKLGLQVVRTTVGRGRVTVINSEPFRYRGLFDGDHARFFVAATELRAADDVHFLSEDEHPSLLALTWRYGGSIVVLMLALIGLALWRTGVRLGPLAAPLQAARRSLAEQIRGTGQFALRHGGGDSLHAASVRALDEAAARRVAGYARLSAKERGAALAELTGLDRHALLKAIHHEGARRATELRDTIALLEAARRLTLVLRQAQGEHKGR
jgi:hypothetical protein